MKTKVLLDTDIGSDIDDAVCLAYLLAQPDCELLGITTVTGEAEKRAMLASALCRVAGKSVPIFPGAEQPLLVPQLQPTAPQAAALERWPHESRFDRGRAVEFLRETIRRHPGEVTLLTIGPLTNIALLFATDPEIPALLKALVMMVGDIGEQPVPEWNAKLDPQAATIVYKHRVAAHWSIGLNVTTQVTMAADEVRRRFRAPVLRPVLDFAEVWFRDRPVITFHDPLAATTIFNRDVCRFERGQVDMDLSGLTRWRSGAADAPHQFATVVDAAKFFDCYFSAFASNINVEAPRA